MYSIQELKNYYKELLINSKPTTQANPVNAAKRCICWKWKGDAKLLATTRGWMCLIERQTSRMKACFEQLYDVSISTISTSREATYLGIYTQPCLLSLSQPPIRAPFAQKKLVTWSSCFPVARLRSATGWFDVVWMSYERKQLPLFPLLV